jgi:hypothetical protein
MIWEWAMGGMRIHPKASELSGFAIEGARIDSTFAAINTS